MKVWGLIRTRHKIMQDTVYEQEGRAPDTLEQWAPVVSRICQTLDLSRPVLLGKHIKELKHFGRTVFKADDFMEPIAFGQLELEIFKEPKEEEHPV